MKGKKVSTQRGIMSESYIVTVGHSSWCEIFVICVSASSILKSKMWIFVFVYPQLLLLILKSVLCAEE